MHKIGKDELHPYADSLSTINTRCATRAGSVSRARFHPSGISQWECHDLQVGGIGIRFKARCGAFAKCLNDLLQAFKPTSVQPIPCPPP